MKKIIVLFTVLSMLHFTVIPASAAMNSADITRIPAADEAILEFVHMGAGIGIAPVSIIAESLSLAQANDISPFEKTPDISSNKITLATDIGEVDTETTRFVNKKFAPAFQSHTLPATSGTTSEHWTESDNETEESRAAEMRHKHHGETDVKLHSALEQQLDTNLMATSGTTAATPGTTAATPGTTAETGNTNPTADNDADSGLSLRPIMPLWPAETANGGPDRGQNRISIEIPLDFDYNPNNNQNINKSAISAINDGNSTNANGSLEYIIGADQDVRQNINANSTRLPDTGDAFKPGAALIAGGASLLALVALSIFKRRKKKSKNSGKS